MKEKRCVVCGNKEGYSAPGDNLTDNDRKIKHCEDCGQPVCGFCSHLGVCCEMVEEDEDDDELQS